MSDIQPAFATNGNGAAGTAPPTPPLFGEVKFEPVRKCVDIRVTCAFLSVEQSREAEAVIKLALQHLVKAGSVTHTVTDGAPVVTTTKPAPPKMPRAAPGSVEKAVLAAVGLAAGTFDAIAATTGKNPASVRSALRNLAKGDQPKVVLDGDVYRLPVIAAPPATAV